MEGPSPIESGEDPLAPYRGRILYGLASAAAVCLLPFSVNAFVQGNPGLGWESWPRSSSSASTLSPST